MKGLLIDDVEPSFVLYDKPAKICRLFGAQSEGRKSNVICIDLNTLCLLRMVHVCVTEINRLYFFLVKVSRQD